MVRKRAVVLSVCFGVMIVMAFLTVPQALIGPFLDQTKAHTPEIMAYGATLLVVAALFQLFDAMQVIALGLLRGVQDTRAPMLIAAFSYWLIGVPTSYALAFGLGMGGTGLWLGLATGLALAASLLMMRYWRGPWLNPAV